MQTQEELDQVLQLCRDSEAPTNVCRNDEKKRLCKEIPYFECKVLEYREILFKNKKKQPKTAEEMTP